LAVISLGVYGLLILAIFKLWPVTLTLSSLAGFILSIGMAVDANVLIFERLKEELRYGKPLGKAIDEGFKRAWPSIRDGNYSTLITCFILIQFTTSIVRGFALTLGLGILMSIFSAIVVTKNLLKLVAGKRLENNSWLMGVKKPKENNN
jgi:preprotein translocase subunit SecD